MPPELRSTVLALLERRRGHGRRAAWMHAGVALTLVLEGLEGVPSAGGGTRDVVVLVLGVLGLATAVLDAGSRRRAARRLAEVAASP